MRWSRWCLVAVIVVTGCSSDSKASPETDPGTFCSFLLSFRATNDTIDDALSSGDLDSSRAAVQLLVHQVDLLQNRAPADIKADVDVVADFVHQFDALMADNNYDLAAIEASPAAAEAFFSINNAPVAASLEQLRAYADQDCASSATGG